MLWTRGLIGAARQIETVEPKEELVPQPHKMWNNCAKKGTVSPVTNKATSLGTVQISPPITNKTNKRRIPKPDKLILMNMKLLMRKIMKS